MKKISKRSSEMAKSGKPVSNNSIARAVMCSQPPHKEDVPDMVDYVQKWGGGASEYYLNDLARFYRAMNLSSSCRVSGRTFKALAALNFGTEMPSHAVTAVLKRVAASEKVIDGCGSSLSPSNIATFGQKLKIPFLQANDLMKTCEATLSESGIDDPVATGWLQMTLIDHVLGRPNRDGTSFKDMKSIVAEFLRRAFGEAPVAPCCPASVCFVFGYRPI